MMDTPKPQQKPAHLLDDLESIRQLLGDDDLQPPLLTETVDSDVQIPLLFDMVDGSASPVPPAPQATAPSPAVKPVQGADALLYLDRELRAAAHLIMQDVIDDFAPHIETEIKRRLDVRLERLLNQYPS